MRFVFIFALSTIIFIISSQIMSVDATINKPNKTISNNVSKPKMNVSKPIRQLPTINISKPSSPKAVPTVVPAPPMLDESNSPVTPQNDEFSEIAIGSDDEAEEEAPKEEIEPIKKTKTKSKSSTIERLLNNPTVRTLLKGGSVAGGGLISTVFVILIMCKMLKSL